ncbi:SAM-dependent methyltransferase [Streptomyces sp. NPDC053750]|uniref:SAM-dependent methyltransferase n=1 Tax=Streptomyces sp. NPDC053750 TaxID=3365714 RepID=UPI0037CF9020
MPGELSPRLAAIVDALPLTPDARVLEIGCGPGAAARAVAARLVTGHVLAVGRSARAIAQAEAGSARELASGRPSLRCLAAEDFVREPGEAPFDLVYAVRVGALDGRRPEAGRRALERIAAAPAPGGRVFVDGGRPLREISVPRGGPGDDPGA